jgi:hypothetical protein
LISAAVPAGVSPTPGDVAGWLPDRPLDRRDLADLEARDPVARAATVRRETSDGRTLAVGIQAELVGGVVYLLDRAGGGWTAERYTGPNLWQLRDRRGERIDGRARD